MPYTKLRLTVFTCAAAVLLCACQENPPPYEPTPTELNVTISSIELTGLTVNEITRITTADNSSLSVAATSAGLYVYNGSDWQAVTSQRWEIQDFLAVENDHWLAVVGSDNSYQSILIRSLDQGVNWSTVTNNFGGSAKPSEITPEPMYRLASNAAGDKLYAVGTQVLAESLDAGTTWQAISGIWNGFASGYRTLINISAGQAMNDTELFFYGGQGAIENPVLTRFDVISSFPNSYTQGTEISIDVAAEDLLPVPSEVRAIVPVNAKAGDFVVTGEGGLIRTFDNGQSWQPVHTNTTSRFYFDMLTHPQFPDVWVTAGWNKNFATPQAFIVEISLDGGQNWQAFSWEKYQGEAIFGGIRSMAWADDSTSTVHFGTTRGGIITVDISLPE